jgi:3-hydroxymyristoyl/3-hydroxydecanoyl-(acyl carrier protein) dehydratase
MAQWQELTHIRVSGEDEITAEVRVEAQSPWFSGHFPGDPVLPGIAQLFLVRRVIEEARDCRLRISEIRRVRFKQVIRPGDALQLQVTPLPETADAYAFRVLLGTEVACTGHLAVKEV